MFRTRRAACSLRSITSPRARGRPRARPLELLTASADTRGAFFRGGVMKFAKCSMLALFALTAAPAIAWEPTKPVEIVVAAGAGGASDQMARMMQAAIQKNNLMKQPVVVSLKGGASGAEALIYMKSSEGDPNKVLIAYSLIYMLPLSAKIPFNWRDLTPISVIALDEFVLWVNAQLPYKTVKEFADAAKSATPPFKMGGTGSRRQHPVLTVFLEQKTGETV